MQGFLTKKLYGFLTADQLLWYADTLSFVLRGRFLIGVAKYLQKKDTVSLRHK